MVCSAKRINKLKYILKSSFFIIFLMIIFNNNSDNFLKYKQMRVKRACGFANTDKKK